MNKSKVTWYMDMYNRVIFVCDNNTDIIQDLIPLDEAYQIFKPKVAHAKTVSNQISTESNGYAEHKDKVWHEMALTLEGLCAAVRAYAQKQNNIELRAQAKFSPSAFEEKRGTDAIALGRNLITLVNSQVANLADYKVTPAKITAATTMLDVLENLNPKPTGQRSVDKALREQLVKEIREINILLRQEMDDLVKTLKLTESLFVDEYFNARRIQRTGIRHQQPDETAMAEKSALPGLDWTDAGTTGEELYTASKDALPPPLGPDDAESSPDTNGSSKPNEAPPTGEGA
jgi:hypothetical protein